MMRIKIESDREVKKVSIQLESVSVGGLQLIEAEGKEPYFEYGSLTNEVIWRKGYSNSTDLTLPDLPPGVATVVVTMKVEGRKKVIKTTLSIAEAVTLRVTDATDLSFAVAVINDIIENEEEGVSDGQ
jgi:hypothetical protein